MVQHPETMNFVEVMQNASAASSSDIVYAVDENGNQVAVGLLIPTGFQQVSAEDNSPLVAAEEECHSSQEGVALAGKVIKEEKAEIGLTDEASTESDRNQREKNLGLIKTYKRRSTSKKTLRDMKAQMEKKVKERLMQKISSRSMKSISQRRKKGVLTMRKRRNCRKNYDKTYKVPSSVSRQYLPSIIYFHISLFFIQLW